MEGRMEKASRMVSEYDYENRPMPAVRQGGIEAGYDYLSANIARLDESTDTLLSKLEPITRSLPTPDLSVNDKRDPELSSMAISMYDKGDWVKRLAQRIEYFIERIDL